VNKKRKILRSKEKSVEKQKKSEKRLFSVAEHTSGHDVARGNDSFKGVLGGKKPLPVFQKKSLFKVHSLNEHFLYLTGGGDNENGRFPGKGYPIMTRKTFGSTQTACGGRFTKMGFCPRGKEKKGVVQAMQEVAFPTYRRAESQKDNKKGGSVGHKKKKR